MQYGLDDTYDCWTALFGPIYDYETVAFFEFLTGLSDYLEAIVNEYPTEELQSVLTLQYLVDCGYDCILIEY